MFEKIKKPVQCSMNTAPLSSGVIWDGGGPTIVVMGFLVCCSVWVLSLLLCLQIWA